MDKMERKAFHALLLSLAVIAGAVTITTDAYAQTNTERLITVVDNTNEANSLLSDILDAVTSGFANVLEMLGVIDTDLEAIHGDLEDIHGDLSAVDADLQDIHGDLTTIHSDIDALSSNLAGVGQAASALSEVSQSLSTVTQGVQTNAASINALDAKLDMIAASVGVVSNTTTSIQEAVETDSATTATPTGNMLHSDDTEQAITVADFAGTVTKHPTDHVYETSNTFSCTGDVFIDTMSVSTVNSVLESNADTAGATAKSTITVEGFFLYEATNVGVSPTIDHVEIIKTRDFDNRFLRAGDGIAIKGSTDQSRALGQSDSLVQPPADRVSGDFDLLNYNGTEPAATAYYFSIQDYVGLKTNKATIGPTFTQDGANASANATKTQLGTVELYTITVNWFAPSSDTTCSISSATGSAPGLDNSATRLVSLTVDDDADEPGALKPFDEAKLDCNGEDTEITSISIGAGGFLTQYVELTLTAGSESAKVMFDGDESDAEKSELPFRFSGSDLTITGKGINDLLLTISYDTVAKNTCS